MQPLRVIHCAETIKGGIASYLRELVRLQRQDYGPDAITVVIPASQKKELPSPDGVRIVTFADHGGRIANAWQMAIVVARETRQQRADVVHAHSTFAGAISRPMLFAMGHARKVVYCPHGWAWDRDMSNHGRWAVRWVERALAPLCRRIVCISQHEWDAAVSVGISRRRLTLVVNGVAEQAPLPDGSGPYWPVGPKKLLFVGRFDRQKGVDLFCQALARLGDEAFGVLAGGAVLSDHGHIELPPNAKAVGWVGPQTLESLFQEADVLVMPSRWEGFGLIAAEAMRSGLAVVATEVGGLSEIVVDGETGRLVPPDDVDALVEALRRSDVSAWQRMGLAGQKRFHRHFTMARVHNQLDEIYRQTKLPMEAASRV